MMDDRPSIAPRLYSSITLFSWKRKYLETLKERDEALKVIEDLKKVIDQWQRLTHEKDALIKSQIALADQLRENYYRLVKADSNSNT